MRIEHVAMYVEDLEKTKNFYKYLMLLRENSIIIRKQSFSRIF